MSELVPQETFVDRHCMNLVFDSIERADAQSVGDPVPVPDDDRARFSSGGIRSDNAFWSPLISITHFPPSTPRAGEEDYCEYYKETLEDFAKEPDFRIRKAAVDARRLHEFQISYCAKVEEIVVAYDLFWNMRFVVAGHRTWVSLLRGQLTKLTRILPLYCHFENLHEMEGMIETVKAVRGKCSCQVCEPEPVS